MVVVLILLAFAARLLPHPPNFSPVAAVGLFAGATLRRRFSWLIPLAALALSDLLLPAYPRLDAMVWNYAAFAACLLVGSGWLAPRLSAGRLAGAVLSSSVVFFAISNFSMWASGYYPRTLAGLAQCYTQAIPFFPNTLMSDALYTAVLFGVHALVRAYVARPRSASARA